MRRGGRDACRRVRLSHNKTWRHERSAISDGRGVASELERVHAHVALPNAQVDGVARSPSRWVNPVVVRRVWNQARALIGKRKIERRVLSKPKPIRPTAPPIEVHADALGVLLVDKRVVHQPEKERVARDTDRCFNRDVAVASPVAPVQPAEHVATCAVQLGLRRDHPLLEGDHRHKRLPRRARRHRRSLGRPVEVGLLGVAVQVVHLRLGEPVAVDIQVVVRRRDHRDDAARLHVDHDRSAALVHEQALGKSLDGRIHSQRQRHTRLRVDVFSPPLVALHLHAVDVLEHELAPNASSKHRLVRGLNAALPDSVSQAVALLTHPVELVGADLVDEPKRVRQPCWAVVSTLLVLTEADTTEPILVLLKPGERPKRHVLEQHVLLILRARRDLIVAGLHVLEVAAGELGHKGQRGLVEVAWRHRHRDRRLIVDQQQAISVEDVPPRRPDDLGLDGVALCLRRVLLLVYDLHLNQTSAQKCDHPQHENAEDAKAEASVVSGRGGENRGHTCVWRVGQNQRPVDGQRTNGTSSRFVPPRGFFAPLPHLPRAGSRPRGRIGSRAQKNPPRTLGVR